MLVIVFIIYIISVSIALFLWYKAQQHKFKTKGTVNDSYTGIDGDLLIISFVPFVNILTIALIISRLWGENIIEFLNEHFSKTAK